MKIDIVTIFPEYFAALDISLLGKARRTGLLDVNVHDLRDWTHDRHRTVDDTPYGGGPGMVMKPGPWGEALDALIPPTPPAEPATPDPPWKALDTPVPLTSPPSSLRPSDPPPSDPPPSGLSPSGSPPSGAPSDQPPSGPSPSSSPESGTSASNLPSSSSPTSSTSASELPLSPTSAAPSSGLPPSSPSAADAPPRGTEQYPGADAADMNSMPPSGVVPRLIIPTPSGRPFTQVLATRYASEPWLVFACGRYEGIDARVVEEARTRMPVDEVSLGDFVLAGGEVAVLVMIEAIGRLLPGVLGNADSVADDSFAPGAMESLLEGPVYTKPPVWRERPVPEILLSGHHGAIARWRRDEALRRTARHRPDLLDRLAPDDLDEQDRAVLREAGFPVDGKDMAD